jgi:hypothetical protein
MGDKKMRNKPVVLYGCGYEGKKFYWKYREELDIRFAVDQNAREKEYFYVIPKRRIDEIEDIENYFVIVTTGSENWISIKAVLENKGLKCDMDFTWSRWFKKKRIAVLYGNCHMEVLGKYFHSNIDFQREYEVYLYILYKDINIEILKGDIEHCDLFVTQDVRKENKHHRPSADSLISITRSGCRSIRIPNLHGMNLFYPQMDLRRLGEQDSVIEDVAYYVIGRGDEIIESGFRNGKTVDEMEDEISNTQIFSEALIKGVFETGLQKLKKRELDCDILISDFIERNYKKVQLFYEPVHPTNVLILEKANRVLELIGYNAVTEDEIQMSLLDGCDQEEAFIYPCVRETLGLEYEQNYIRKNKGVGFRNSALTLREYIEDYYKVLRIGMKRKCDLVI